MGIFGNAPIGNWSPPNLDTGVGQVKKPGFFSAGNISSIFDILGDGFAGTDDYRRRQFSQQQQQQERQQSLQDYQMKRTDENADWQAREQYKIDHPAPVQPGEQERLISTYASLPDNDPRKPLIERAIRGYQYTAPVMDAKQAQAEELLRQRFANSASLKSMPSYSNLHPASGGKAAATRVVGGKAYYKINGAWYDNPEGR
jgi:hypothetical protein